MPEVKKQLGTQFNRALFDLKSIDEKARTIDVVFATETPVLRRNWDGTYYEVLDCNPASVRMDRLNAGAPVLNNHSRYSVTDVLGVVEAASFVKKEGRATLRFSTREDVNPIWGDVKNGITRGISVGYNVWQYDVTEKTGEIPVYRATDWEPAEISLAPIPADVNSGTRSAENLHTVIINSKNNNMPENVTPQERTQQITEAVRAVGLEDAYATELINNEELSVDQARAAIFTKLGETKKAKPAAKKAEDTPATQPAAAAATQERASEIVHAVRAAGMGIDYAFELINTENLTADQARQAILNKMAEKQIPAAKPAGNLIAVTGLDETTKQRNAIITGLALRSGLVTEKSIAADLLEGSRQYRSISLLDVAKESLTRAGIDYSGLDKMALVARAITSSTSDFPVLLQGVIHKTLLANYQIAADSWRKFCFVGSVSDFREHKRLRMGSFSRLDKIQENGEFKNKKITDAEQEGISAETYGNIINVSRKMIVNDDLNAFSRLAMGLARAAARSIELDVYALLASNPTMADGNALFHANHNNIGTAGAPTVAAFDEMRVLMAKQKDKDSNDFLDLRPANLVIGIHQGGTAKVLNSAVYDPETANKLQKPNMVNGMFSNIIDTAQITTNAYYAFADANIEPTIEVAFLDGVQDPFLEQHQEFNVDGMSWKVRLDYGVDAIGWRGAVKNVGG